MITLMITSCAKESLKGSGNIVKETRSVAYFENVHLNGSGTVTVNYAPNQKVEVEGYQNLVPAFDTYVSNGTLILEYKHQYTNIKNNNIHITIETPLIKGLTINGSGNGSINGNFPAQTTLSLFINGSGNLTTSAFPLDDLNVRINGSGDIRTNALAKTADAKITGSGYISLIALNSLKAVIDGSGTIDYAGNPTNVQTQISGSGKINKK